MPCYGMTASNYGDYYRGDYYRGDYYRGDPFLHRKIFGGIKKVASVAVNLLPGPVGAVARTLVKAAGGLVGGPGSVGPALSPYGPGGLTVGEPIPPPPPLRAPPPPTPATTSYGGFPLEVGKTGISCLRNGGRGRWNKSAYYTAGGVYHPPRTVCVGPRRMNVANPRALRRALRRAQGFAKLAKRFLVVSKKFKKGGRRRRR